jgi:hypothetical protein
LTAALEKHSDPGRRRWLAHALAALAGRLERGKAAASCARAAAALTRALEDSSDPAERRLLAHGLASLAVHLPPEKASIANGFAAATLTAVLAKTPDGEFRELLEGLVAVVARLGPGKAADTAIALNQALAQTTLANTPDNEWRRRYLAYGLAALADCLGPEKAAASRFRAADILVELMGRYPNRDEDWRRATAGELADVLSGVCASGRTRRVASVAAAFSAVPSLASPALLSPALEPLPGQLTTAELVELLKRPLCVGPARRVILDELENRYEQKFSDLWGFVRFAQEQRLGLDFTTPPQRPGATPAAPAR